MEKQQQRETREEGARNDLSEIVRGAKRVRAATSADAKPNASARWLTMHLMANDSPDTSDCAFNTSEKVPSPFFATRRYSASSSSSSSSRMQRQCASTDALEALMSSCLNVAVCISRSLEQFRSVRNWSVCADCSGAAGARSLRYRTRAHPAAWRASWTRGATHSRDDHGGREWAVRCDWNAQSQRCDEGELRECGSERRNSGPSERQSMQSRAIHRARPFLLLRVPRCLPNHFRKLSSYFCLPLLLLTALSLALLSSPLLSLSAPPRHLPTRITNTHHGCTCR